MFNASPKTGRGNGQSEKEENRDGLEGLLALPLALPSFHEEVWLLLKLELQVLAIITGPVAARFSPGPDI